MHCARCLYESHLDVVDLLRDPSLLPKFMAFTFVARFAAAEKLASELTAQGITDPSINAHERMFIADSGRRARFDAERATHWPDRHGNPTTPLNWTGKSLPDRARIIGPDELLRYRRLYSLLCWFSHAGIVGIANMSADALETAMGMAHGNSQDFFFATTNLVASHFDIFKANPLLKEAVERYRVAMETVLNRHLHRLRDSIE